MASFFSLSTPSSMSSRSLSAADVERPWSPDFVRKYRTFFFDCDGVLWHDQTPIPGAKDTINRLQEIFSQLNKEAGRIAFRMIFLTNNSCKSRESYKQKFEKLGYRINYEQSTIFTSAYGMAYYLDQEKSFDKKQHKVLYLGDSGIAEELALCGIESVSAGAIIGTDMSKWNRTNLSQLPIDPSIKAVVVGLDDSLSYGSIHIASSHLRANPDVAFVTTNLDSTLPTKAEQLPDAGPAAAAVSVAAGGRQPVNVGKPERFMFDLACDLHDLDPRRCIMIGDRLDTDIAFGNGAGIDTILVESGINKRSCVEHEDNFNYPKYILDDITHLFIYNNDGDSTQSSESSESD